MARIRANEYRTSMICIDSYESGVLCGRFYNQFLSSGQSFLSLVQFLTQMEDLLDRMEFPQSFTVARTFSAPPAPATQGELSEEFHTGACGTFAIRVLFRQNASWQGSITWVEGNREQSFRSVLELIMLIDSALRA